MYSMLRISTARRSSALLFQASSIRHASTDAPLMAKVREGLKQAMRSGNTTEKDVIRAIISEVKNKTIADPASVGTDLKMHGLLRSMIVTRMKSIAEFKTAGRDDLVEKETAELAILKRYAGMVTVASDEELDVKIKAILATLPEADQKSMNKVMAAIPWKEVESQWNSSRNAVAGGVKRVLGIRSFSTSARQLNHSNPLGLPRRRQGGGQGGGVPGRRAIPGVKKILAVSSAKGGVGKSTVSANLALALFERGLNVGILDIDIFGPSVPKIFNLTNAGEPELVPENGHLVPIINYGVKTMSMGYLVDPNKAVAWRGLLVQKALQQLLFEVQWAGKTKQDPDLDVLVLDMPPGTGDVQLTLAQQVQIDGAVLVSTPQDLALIDVVRGLDLFRIVKTPVVGIVENMSSFICPNCQHESHIFGGGEANDKLSREAQERGVQVLAKVPLAAEICASADSGMPTMVSAPESVPAQAYRELAGKVCGSLGV